MAITATIKNGISTSGRKLAKEKRVYSLDMIRYSLLSSEADAWVAGASPTTGADHRSDILATRSLHVAL